jgi:hypothetical protein
MVNSLRSISVFGARLLLKSWWDYTTHDESRQQVSQAESREVRSPHVAASIRVKADKATAERGKQRFILTQNTWKEAET